MLSPIGSPRLRAEFDDPADPTARFPGGWQSVKNLGLPERIAGVSTAVLDVPTLKLLEALRTTNFLKDQTVVVTGGASGIGHGITAVANMMGAKVEVIDASPRAASMFQDMEGITGHVVNITDHALVESTIQEIAARSGGKIHKLVLNAGIFQENGCKIDDINLTEFSRLLDINVAGNTAVFKYAAQYLRACGLEENPLAELIGSRNRLRPSNSLGYSVSKMALMHLGKAIANSEVPAHFAVVGLDPDAVVDSPLWGPTAEEREKKLLRQRQKQDYLQNALITQAQRWKYLLLGK